MKRLKEISKNRNVSKLGVHIVFCPKYRKTVFDNELIKIELKKVLGETCITYNWILHEIEVMEDHVHMFIQIKPTDRLTDVARTLKSISAIYIFNKFPKLKAEKFWGSGLWSDGTFYSSVGSVSEEAVRMYIRNQNNK